MPDPSTVASAIALGSFGSLRSASSSHAAKSANGSPVSVKSACVLGASRVMQELYCRPPPFSTPDPVSGWTTRGICVNWRLSYDKAGQR